MSLINFASKLDYKISNLFKNSKFNVVSDIFYFRNDEFVTTFFNFSANLLTQTNVKVKIILKQFDGVTICEKNLEFNHQIIRLSIRDILANHKSNIKTGVFYIFIQDDQSLYTSRGGYISYIDKRLPLPSFVHGNLDALFVTNTGAIDSISNALFLSRTYNVQYQFDYDTEYMLFLVNPSPSDLFFYIKLINPTKTQEIQTKIRAKNGKLIDLSNETFLNISISARVPMPRPLIIKKCNSFTDYFHA